MRRNSWTVDSNDEVTNYAAAAFRPFHAYQRKPSTTPAPNIVSKGDLNSGIRGDCSYRLMSIRAVQSIFLVICCDRS